jgi:hypothetical protein
MRARQAWFAAAVQLGACNRTFECVDASSCRLDGAQGTCEASGHCSFPDGDCPSGRRYGEFAPDDIAGDCVDDRCPPTPACTRFVSPLGSDEGDGSELAPFASVQLALDIAGPGDVICLREGEYSGRVTMAISGTADAPIVLRSHPGETARLRDGMLISAGWGVEVGWLVVEDLDITQEIGTPESPDQCIFFHGAHDVVLRHNVLHDCYGSATAGNVHRVVFDGNRITRCGLSFVEERELSTLGLTGSDVVVQNNVIHDNNGYGVAITANPWDEADPNAAAGPEYNGGAGWVITNNVIAFGRNRAGVLAWQPGATDSLVQNNVFLHNAEVGPVNAGPNGIDFYGCGPGHRVRNNVYFGSAQPILDTLEGGSYVETDAREEDPAFVDATGSDFRLTPQSPAIDAGFAEDAPDHDLECSARPLGGAVDIGAYEASR